ncbi:hypothetical protein CBL_12063 [Carabus blaptoides fortunei]
MKPTFKFQRLHNTERLEQAITELTLTIETAITDSSCTPTRHKYILTLPTDILNIIKLKNRSRRRHQHTSDPADTTCANRLQSEVTKALQDYSKKGWEEKHAVKLHQYSRTTASPSQAKLQKGTSTRRYLETNVQRGIRALTAIFNADIRLDDFPSSIEEDRGGDYTTGKDPTFARNYGTISLFTTIGKTFEK